MKNYLFLISILFSTILVKAEEETLILDRGKYLFELSGCALCHTQKDQPLLSGGAALNSPFGKFYPPNITKDTQTGIGNWTDNQFIRALREGISPTGTHYYPLFPYSSFSKMTDEDLLAIKSYIFSLPAVENIATDHEVRFSYSLRLLVGVWKKNNLKILPLIDENNFIQARGPYKNLTQKDPEWNRGAYLVEGALHCAQCHTPKDSFGNFKWNQWMGGAKLFGEKKSAPNITSDVEMGVGLWTEKDWDVFLTEGTTPNGDEVTGVMKLIVEHQTSKLTIEDKKAVINYLMSLKPVSKE